MWYMYTTEYYPTKRKKEILPFATTWMDPKSISWYDKKTNTRQVLYGITYIWNLKRKNPQSETES